jgi:hypothetical protein
VREHYFSNCFVVNVRRHDSSKNRVFRASRCVWHFRPSSRTPVSGRVANACQTHCQNDNVQRIPATQMNWLCHFLWPCWSTHRSTCPANDHDPDCGWLVRSDCKNVTYCKFEWFNAPNGKQQCKRWWWLQQSNQKVLHHKGLANHVGDIMWWCMQVAQFSRAVYISIQCLSIQEPGSCLQHRPVQLDRFYATCV